MASNSHFVGTLNRPEHKKPMDPKFLARMADLRHQTDGASSTNSTPRASLILGSSASILSSDVSDSFSVTSLPLAVDFPPTPVFVDQIPPGMRKLELLSASKDSAAMNSYPSQNSHTVIARPSIDATHDVPSSFTTLSSPDPTPRQKQMKPPPTTMSEQQAPNSMHHTPPRQIRTSTKTTPLSNITQQPSSLTRPASSTNANPHMSVHLTPLPNDEYHKQGLPAEEQHTSWNWKRASLEGKNEDIPRFPRNPEPESFTSQLELKPTFPPSIVRTPQHYRGPSSRTARQDIKQREGEYREREQAEQRRQRERAQDLQERDQRVKHERRELIGSPHTVTPHVDPYVNKSTNHPPGYGSSPFPTSGAAGPSPTHYTPSRQVQTQTTPSSGLATQHSTYAIWYPKPEPPASLPAQVNPVDLHAHPQEKGKHKYTIWHPKPELPASLPEQVNPPNPRTYPPEKEEHKYTIWYPNSELPASLPKQVNPRNLRIHPLEKEGHNGLYRTRSWSPWYPNREFLPSPEPEDVSRDMPFGLFGPRSPVGDYD